ncbi:olfactory guanylyl cyclase GC-D [Corchorus olitorius]|uniref:Olfactory guanylyl cyclase GC-D n=1 Tax=Corchorus olitorius TaxID=93759 RepID=A0A1R3HY38_9ROSI|nr:olfactory guanylyl cyclase GC-D [Corchorus olitorius]
MTPKGSRMALHSCILSPWGVPPFDAAVTFPIKIPPSYNESCRVNNIRFNSGVPTRLSPYFSLTLLV